LKKFNLWSHLRCFASSKAGFTIVEAMVAIAILAIGLLGVGKLLTLSAQYQIGYHDQAGTWHEGNVKNLVSTRTNFNSKQGYSKLK